MTKITFQLNIPDNKATDFIDTTALALGYESIGGPSIPTKAEFVRQRVISFLKENYHSGKSKIAIEQARQAVDEEINSVVIQ